MALCLSCGLWDIDICFTCRADADHQVDGLAQPRQPRVLATMLLIAASDEPVVVSLTAAGDVVTFLPESPAGAPSPDACHEPASRLRHTISTGVPLLPHDLTAFLMCLSLPIDCRPKARVLSCRRCTA